MRKAAPFWSLATLVSDSAEPEAFQVSLEDMVSDTGRLVEGELSHYDAKGTPFVEDDILFGKLRPYLAKYWRADCSGTAGGDIHVYRHAADVEPRFLNYVVGSRDFVKFAEAASKGVKMPRAEWMGLRELVVYRPDLPTQRRIAEYLDHETGEIDGMIQKMDELAGQLVSRKISAIQSLAGAASTTATRPLQWLARLVTGSTPFGGNKAENFKPSGEIGWVTPEDLGHTIEPTRFLSDTALEQMTVIPGGSTLVCGIGATVGKLGYSISDVTTNQQITALIPHQQMHGRYLFYAMAAEKDQLLANTVTTTLPIINNSRLGSLSIKSCSLIEQKRIADQLDRVTHHLDQMLAKVAELKSLLTERRAALITEVVAGRKDVA